MDTALMSSIIVMSVSVAAIILGFVKMNEDDNGVYLFVFIFGCVFALLDCLLGFGVACAQGTPKRFEYIRPVEIIRSKDEVIAKTDNDQLLRNNQHSFYLLKDDEIWVKKTYFYNSYENFTGATYELTTKGE